MLETAREKYSSIVFLAPLGFLPGSRPAQSKGHFSLAHLPTFFTWYYASFDNNSHWATQLFLGVECSLISSFSLPGAFLNSCQISLESIRPIVEGDAEVEGMLRKNAQLRPGLSYQPPHHPSL